jgi:hypothetical protein
MIRKIAVLASSLILSGVLGAGVCSAASITYSDTIDLQTTDWSETLSFQQYDLNSILPLSSIDIIFTGFILGDVEIESRDATAKTVTGNLKATIDLSWTGGDVITTSLPSAEVSFDATAYDGVLDFGGTSGTILTDLYASQTVTTVTYTASDSEFWYFIGSGTVSFDVDAIGVSAAAASGNVLTGFTTQAGAEISVVYNTVPEPSTMLLFGAGVAGLASVTRRKALKK